MNAPIVQGAGHRRSHDGDGGAIPTLALRHLVVSPISPYLAKPLIVQRHYLRSWPGGTKLVLGVFAQHRLMGALTLGAGPSNAFRLVHGATAKDCVTLSRFWLDDLLPPNSASRILGIALRALKKNTDLKFVLSYADPTAGHSGTIYRASGWSYVGLSQITPHYDFGNGIARHPRTVGASIGTRSVKHLRNNGVPVAIVPMPGKHRYVFFFGCSLEAVIEGARTGVSD